MFSRSDYLDFTSAMLAETSIERERELAKSLKYSFLVMALVLGTSSYARADRPFDDPFGNNHKPHQPLSAPEVDPSLAIGGISLLAGTLTVMRAKRRK
jgi:hypothetical protein